MNMKEQDCDFDKRIEHKHSVTVFRYEWVVVVKHPVSKLFRHIMARTRYISMR
jgi:hypothetical protein